MGGVAVSVFAMFDEGFAIDGLYDDGVLFFVDGDGGSGFCEDDICDLFWFGGEEGGVGDESIFDGDDIVFVFYFIAGVEACIFEQFGEADTSSAGEVVAVVCDDGDFDLSSSFVNDLFAESADGAEVLQDSGSAALGSESGGGDAIDDNVFVGCVSDGVHNAA